MIAAHVLFLCVIFPAFTLIMQNPSLLTLIAATALPGALSSTSVGVALATPKRCARMCGAPGLRSLWQSNLTRTSALRRLGRQRRCVCRACSAGANRPMAASPGVRTMPNMPSPHQREGEQHPPRVPRDSSVGRCATSSRQSPAPSGFETK